MLKSRRNRPVRPAPRLRPWLTVQRLEARDIPSTFTPGYIPGNVAPTQVSGVSPFGPAPAGAVADSEVEPFLAVNPQNSANLVSAFQQDRWSAGGGARGVLIRTSTDFGGSWQQKSVPGFDETTAVALS